MTSEQLVTVILAILGVLLQLALKYAPKIKQWYENHQNKGLVALLLSAVIGSVYIGLACTPYAMYLKITIACEQASIFILLDAIFKIAVAQQLTYLYTKNISKPFPVV